MRLIRFGPPGAEKPGLCSSDGRRRDCSGIVPDYDRAFFNGGGLDRLRALSPALVESLPEAPQDQRWCPPIARPGKVIAIGLNYRDHAAESGAQVPAEPVVFMKATSAVMGPYDDIQIPRRSRKTDWEVELAVVIGRDARYLDSPREALGHIAGYCVCNDVSEREFQLERCGQWDKGKGCDTFCPLGPYLVTPEEIPDVQDLPMSLSVNGQVMQKGNTRNMVFQVPFLVHYLSQFMTLEAGDVISTGTPPGVGLGMKPPRYLKPGDVVELCVERLGSQRQRCAQG